MKLFIEESVYKDQNISVYGLSVYCALKTLIVTEEDKNIYVTTELLAYGLSINGYTAKYEISIINSWY